MKLLITISLLFCFGIAQFIEDFIPIPENSPGITGLEEIVYNQTNDKLYLVSHRNMLGILRGSDLRTLKIKMLPGFNRYATSNTYSVWMPQNNKLYIFIDKGVTVLDGATDSVLSTIELLRGPYLNQTWRLAYNETNQRLYITDGWRKSVLVLDALNHNVIDTVKVGYETRYIVWNSINNKVYVSSESLFASRSIALTIFDGTDNRILRTIHFSDTSPRGYFRNFLLYNPASNKIYWSTAKGIQIIDGRQDTIIKTHFLNRHTVGLYWNSVNNKVYALSDDSFYILDGLTDSLKAIKDLYGFGGGGDPFALYSPEHNKFFFKAGTDQGGRLVMVDGATDSIYAEVPIQPGLTGLAFNPQNNKIYLALLGSKEIQLIDVVTYSIDTLVTGTKLLGGIYNPINNQLYLVENNLEHEKFNLIAIDCATRQITAIIPTPGGPEYLILNPVNNKIYVTHNINWISVIDCFSNRVLRTIELPGWAGQLTYNPVNNKVYCASSDYPYWSGVVIIDGQSDTIIGIVEPGFQIETVVWHPGVNKVYCADVSIVGDGRIGVIDGVTNRFLRVIPRPMPGIRFTNRLIYNSIDQKLYGASLELPRRPSHLCIYDAIADTFIKVIPTDYIWGLVWAKSSNKIYFDLEEGQNQYIGVVDGSEDSLIKQIPQPLSSIMELFWDSLNNKVYGATYDGFLFIDPNTDSLVGTIETSVGAEGIHLFSLNTFDNRVFFVPNEGSQIWVFRDNVPGIGNESHQMPIKKSYLRTEPNPFKQQTIIRFSLSAIRYPLKAIQIYDITGKLVKSFPTVSGKRLADSGIVWDGKDELGKRLSSGIYFLRLETKDFTETKKVIITE